jgi:LAGLIDADG endonuclease
MTAANQQERLSFTEPHKWFLAGFVEGEGSVCVSVKQHPTARFGFYVHPEFFLYQFRGYPQMLELARAMFGSGSIFPKPGNERVLVYAIASRKAIASKVIPFLREYMVFAPRNQIYERFCEIVEAMERREHLTPPGMVQIVEKAYALNPVSKGKERKRSLQEVTDRILRDYTPDSGPIEAPEMI